MIRMTLWARGALLYPGPYFGMDFSLANPGSLKVEATEPIGKETLGAALVLLKDAARRVETAIAALEPRKEAP